MHPHTTAHQLAASVASHALVARMPDRKLATVMPHTTAAVSDGETSRSTHRCRSCKLPTCTWKSSRSASPFSSVCNSGEGRVQRPDEQLEQGVDGAEDLEKTEGRYEENVEEGGGEQV